MRGGGIMKGGKNRAVDKKRIFETASVVRGEASATRYIESEGLPLRGEKRKKGGADAISAKEKKRSSMTTNFLKGKKTATVVGGDLQAAQDKINGTTQEVFRPRKKKPVRR